MAVEITLAQFNFEHLKRDGKDMLGKGVKDGAVAGYFDIFRKKQHRLFQWVAHPEIPAENNLAERRLRPRLRAEHLSDLSA